MGAVQIPTSTTSQLAIVNAIQAGIAASTYWTVNATGTTSTGYKYVEARPTNVASTYANYRILFVERINTATGKTAANNTVSPFNTATNVMVLFCPDGGLRTFTPANIDTASEAYVGTLYKNGAAGTSTYWLSIATPVTALWFYEGDGALWMVSRNSAVSHSLFGMGSIQIVGDTSKTDYIPGTATEWGIPGIYARIGMNNTSGMLTQFPAASSSTTNLGTNIKWYYPGSNIQRLVLTANVLTNPGIGALGTTPSVTEISQNGTYAFIPALTDDVSATSYMMGYRGLYYSGLFQTRTTLQTGSPLATIGYTFLPDDASNTITCLCFLNLP